MSVNNSYTRYNGKRPNPWEAAATANDTHVTSTTKQGQHGREMKSTTTTSTGTNQTSRFATPTQTRYDDSQLQTTIRSVQQIPPNTAEMTKHTHNQHQSSKQNQLVLSNQHINNQHSHNVPNGSGNISNQKQRDVINKKSIFADISEDRLMALLELNGDNMLDQMMQMTGETTGINQSLVLHNSPGHFPHTDTSTLNASTHKINPSTSHHNNKQHHDIRDLFQHDFDQLEAALFQSYNFYETRINKFAQEASDYQQLLHVNEQIKNENKMLQDILTTTNAKLGDCNQKIQSLQSLLQNKVQQIMSLQNEVQHHLQTQKDLKANIVTITTNFSTQEDRLQRENTALKETIQQYQTEMIQVVVLKQQNDAFRQQNDANKRQIKLMEDEMLKMKTEYQKLQNDYQVALRTSTDLQQQYKLLLQQNQQQQQQYLQQQKQNNQLTKQNNQNANDDKLVMQGQIILQQTSELKKLREMCLQLRDELTKAQHASYNTGDDQLLTDNTLDSSKHTTKKNARSKRQQLDDEDNNNNSAQKTPSTRNRKTTTSKKQLLLLDDGIGDFDPFATDEFGDVNSKDTTFEDDDADDDDRLIFVDRTNTNTKSKTKRQNNNTTKKNSNLAAAALNQWDQLMNSSTDTHTNSNKKILATTTTSKMLPKSSKKPRDQQQRLALAFDLSSEEENIDQLVSLSDPHYHQENMNDLNMIQPDIIDNVNDSTSKSTSATHKRTKRKSKSKNNEDDEMDDYSDTAEHTKKRSKPNKV